MEGQRLYTCPDGNAVPSVTTILDKTKPEEKKQALMKWRRSVGEQKAQQIVTEAANRGTRMHKYLEDHINGETLKESVTNPYAQQSLDMAKIVIKEGLKHVDEFWGTEVALYFPERKPPARGLQHNKPIRRSLKKGRCSRSRSLTMRLYCACSETKAAWPACPPISAARAR